MVRPIAAVILFVLSALVLVAAVLAGFGLLRSRRSGRHPRHALMTASAVADGHTQSMVDVTGILLGQGPLPAARPLPDPEASYTLAPMTRERITATSLGCLTPALAVIAFFLAVLALVVLK